MKRKIKRKEIAICWAFLYGSLLLSLIWVFERSLGWNWAKGLQVRIWMRTLFGLPRIHLDIHILVGFCFVLVHLWGIHLLSLSFCIITAFFSPSDPPDSSVPPRQSGTRGPETQTVWNIDVYVHFMLVGLLIWEKFHFILLGIKQPHTQMCIVVYTLGVLYKVLSLIFFNDFFCNLGVCMFASQFWSSWFEPGLPLVEFACCPHAFVCFI